jgi:hypothetical protein
MQQAGERRLACRARPGSDTLLGRSGRLTARQAITSSISSTAGMAYEGLMVSVSGVRGRVGEALSPEVVARFAAAFGAWSIARPRGNGAAPSRAIVLGRDSRVSGPLFHRVASAALESVGAQVIDVGLTTTPTCQLAVEHHHAAGGLMLSASHNPIEWNALKFIGPTGLFLDASEGAAMRAAMEHGVPTPRGTASARRWPTRRPRGGISTPCSRSRSWTSRGSARGASRWCSTAATAPAR